MWFKKQKKEQKQIKCEECRHHVDKFELQEVKKVPKLYYLQ